MVDQKKIISAVKARGGNWELYFRREGAGYQCILFPRLHLTYIEYAAMAQQLAGVLSKEQIRRNALHYKANQHG